MAYKIFYWDKRDKVSRKNGEKRSNIERDMRIIDFYVDSGTKTYLLTYEVQAHEIIFWTVL